MANASAKAINVFIRFSALLGGRYTGALLALAHWMMESFNHNTGCARPPPSLTACAAQRCLPTNCNVVKRRARIVRRWLQQHRNA
ncbi:hypothetical protein [Xanthomonas sp. CFBP 7912]|uniref:hypothetical protein n=1 Tax=Xanthomonas sp. CFBP 7912 TaxID=1891621 RepID=UPI0018FEB1C6|nr:hypothetical protein [Xanthomonas sp. CFBP 7912]